MELIQGQWSDKVGGVRWKVDGDYIASISTVEAALCAVRLYEQNKDDSYCHLLRNVFMVR